jgi:hypothetical protein
MDAEADAPNDLRGAQILGETGEVLGHVVDVFSDQLTGQWEWALVAAPGEQDDRGHRFMPLAEASVEEAGLRVPYTADEISSAPDVGGAGHLNVDDEAQLYVHYGLDAWEQGSKSGGRTGGTPTGVPLSPHSDAGPQGSAPGDDGAVV